MVSGLIAVVKTAWFDLVNGIGQVCRPHGPHAERHPKVLLHAAVKAAVVLGS